MGLGKGGREGQRGEEAHVGPLQGGVKREAVGDQGRGKPQNMQKPFPLSRKINNRYINKLYQAMQLFKAF